MDKSKAQNRSADAGHLKAAKSRLQGMLKIAGMNATPKPKRYRSK